MIKAQGKLDPLLLIVVAILVIFGIVMVFSASFYSTISEETGPYHYLRLAVQWAIFGFAVMITVSFLPYKVYYNLTPLIIGASLIFLLLLFTPLGVEINYATRWLPLGPLTFMPGEFAKLAVILGCAWYYTKYADKTKTLLNGFLPVIMAALIYFYLIYRQPNLSTAVIVVLTVLVMMFIAGVPVAYLIGILVVGVAGVYFMIQSAAGFHMSRITGYLNPFSDAQGDFFQTVQGLLALGSGGLGGVGLGNSGAKAFWLPYAQNDFIFAIIGEETGFIGSILLLVGFIILVWRCMLISMRCKDRFGMLLGSGISIIFAIQVALNIGVVTAVLPPTGVILPFISYGGNAIVLFMFLIGIVLNISRGETLGKASRRKQKDHELEEDEAA
ncbi:MAG: putative lipid II flippase FtsW [Clostridiales bacterium]|nr:putative lipid II flippase FtsW [Clostridiales bacterium]